MSMRVLVLAGDGIGPEVVTESIKVLDAVARQFNHRFDIHADYVGGVSIDKHGTPLSESVLNLALGSDAVLVGAVGSAKWDHLDSTERPEAGLLRLRKELNLYVNLRPIKPYECLLDCSSIKREIIKGVDLVFVRELTGGLYFGKPKKRFQSSRGERAVDTMVYTEKQIRRTVKIGFEMAKLRRRVLTSVDKMNVLETSRLWRDVVTDVSRDFPEVRLNHMLVDNAALQIALNPGQFDVIVTENTFGDILSDEAAVICGTLGMLPSASLAGSPYAGQSRVRRRPGLYEPVHGAGPSIVGRNLANPIGAILSIAMMLKLSFGLKKESEIIEKAVESVLEDGYRTEDISANSKLVITTSQMGTLIAERVTQMS